MNWKTRTAASIAAVATALLVTAGLAVSPASAATTAPVIKGSLHPVAVALNLSGKTAYVVDGNGFINFVTTSSKKVAHQIVTFATTETSGFLGGGAVSADGSIIWVSNYDGPGGAKLLAYSTSTRKLVHDYSLGGATADAVALTPDGTTALVRGTTTTDPAHDALFEVDTTSGALTTVDLGNKSPDESTAIAVTSDSATAYVTMATGVAKVTLATSDVYNILTLDTPEGLALGTDDSTLFIAESGGAIEEHTNPNRIVVFGGENDVQLTGAALTPDGADLILTGASTTDSTGKAWVLSTATGDEISEDIVGTDPYAIAITAAGTTAYVANNASGTTSILTLKATAPAITNHTPPAGTVGVAYATIWAATGYPSPKYSSTGTIPPGLALDPISGALTGSPKTPGAFTFKIVASNGGPKVSTSKSETVTIKKALAPGTVDVEVQPGTSNVLAVSPGTWGPGTVKLSVQWQTSTNGGSTWKNVSKATKSTLKLTKSYAGREVRALVTGKETGYTTQSVPSNAISITG